MDQERVGQAVRETEQGLLLQAGAGTGKTHWMAERYLALLEAGHSPLEVVAVTFTERAALELRNRIRKRVLERGLGERVLAELEAAPIGTLHALAARICREFP
ncbi:UvrD-helicase domain-containing protein, partial [Thermus sp.]|uniref:UvrD-helicase domain-containing protein n=1 Tax=Thermus sp. TaxID=275 RepID=UPI0025CDC94D